MNYLITYETEQRNEYPKTILVHDLPAWLKENPKSYIIMCVPMATTVATVPSKPKSNYLVTNKR